MALRLITGLMLGAMMCRNCFHFPAPSSSAASYSSPGMDWIAPRKRTKFSPVNRQTETPARETLAEVGSPSQGWSVVTPSQSRTESRVPPSWKKYRKTKPMATPLIR